jgi:arginase
MIIINPQWQGSGFTDEIKKGAFNFADYFRTDILTIPLSDKALTEVNNIKCFHPIVEQNEHFRNAILAHGFKKITTIGGDCGIEIIPISYLNHIYENNLCVIWIDAHDDLSTPESSQSRTFHAMPLRVLLNEGNDAIKQQLFSFLKSDQVCFVGLRTVDEAERDFIRDNGMASLSDPDYRLVEQVIKEKKYEKVYIHLDLDVLDQKEFEHSFTPTANGLKIKEVEKLIKDLKQNFDVVGICITEATATTLEQLAPLEGILAQVRL